MKGMSMNELPTLNRENVNVSGYEAPSRILQIGDGNFIRAFVDWMIDELNRKTKFSGKVISIQATPNGRRVSTFDNQDGLFTLMVRGIKDGKHIEDSQIVQSIQQAMNPYSNWVEVLKVAEISEMKFLFSNTTEAGLSYMKEEYTKGQAPLSFPGKVVALLYHRYTYFNGADDKGWILLPCELIEQNGQRLREICFQIMADWHLPDAFKEWVEASCVFCNTLVDRIVPGYPADDAEKLNRELGYEDRLLTVAEPYHLFVIEGPPSVKEQLPFHQAGLNVHFAEIAPYRDMKVKLLNAPHSIMTALGIPLGISTVSDAMGDEDLFPYLEQTIVEEIILSFPEIDRERARDYMKDVFDRFRNPFLHHRLTDISLNSFSKFGSRTLPCIIAYHKETGSMPRRLAFSIAALLVFYERSFSKKEYKVKDDPEILEKLRLFFSEFNGRKCNLIVFIKDLFHEEITPAMELGELPEMIANDYLTMQTVGIREALRQLER